MSKLVHKKFYTIYDGEWFIGTKASKRIRHMCERDSEGLYSSDVYNYNDIAMCQDCRALVPNDLNTYLFAIGIKVLEEIDQNDRLSALMKIQNQMTVPNKVLRSAPNTSTSQMRMEAAMKRVQEDAYNQALLKYNER